MIDWKGFWNTVEERIREGIREDARHREEEMRKFRKKCKEEEGIKWN